MYTDFRLKVQRFFRKYSKIIFIIGCILVIVFIVNRLLKNYEPHQALQTTYTPHISVVDTSSAVPSNIRNPIEEMIEKYVDLCNDADWEAAWSMLSPVCQEYSFDNNIENFMEYVYTKMPTPKKYAIQDYSNDGNTYIYQIKYTDDMLATGLTNTTYQYTEEKMVFKKQDDGTIQMAVGNFIDYAEIKNISENEYLKVDVKSVVKYYSMEKYTVKFTNRSNYTIVIADLQQEDEIVLQLDSSDTRNSGIDELILQPGESVTRVINFQKFYDNDDDAVNIILNSVRVMEQYSGTQNISNDVIQSEIQNAIAKFSVKIPVNYSSK